MPLENNEPFVRYGEEKKVDSFTVRLNPAERADLEELKSILEQPKDSTALKMLASIGAKVIREEKIAFILETVFKNKRKNKRLGIAQYEA